MNGPVDQIIHILKLLDDENPEIQDIIKDTLLENSLELILRRSAIEEQGGLQSGNSFYSFLERMRFQLTQQALQELAHTGLEDIDLEKAAWVLAFWNNPRVDVPYFQAILDEMAKQIGEHMPQSGHPLAFIDHISYYLFNKFGFRGNREDYYNPENSFIDRVLETRKGIPISLSVLFILVARRLRFPVIGVPMPAHFILKFDNGTDEIFFDPFHEGKIYSRQECLAYLKKARVENPYLVLRGCPDWQIVLRMLRNIRLVFSSYREDPERTAEAERLIELIESNYQ